MGAPAKRPTETKPALPPGYRSVRSRRDPAKWSTSIALYACGNGHWNRVPLERRSFVCRACRERVTVAAHAKTRRYPERDGKPRRSGRERAEIAVARALRLVLSRPLVNLHPKPLDPLGANTTWETLLGIHAVPTPAWTTSPTNPPRPAVPSTGPPLAPASTPKPRPPAPNARLPPCRPRSRASPTA